MKVLKRIFILVLTVIMVVSAFPLAASAAEKVDINTSSVEDDLKSKFDYLHIRFPENSLNNKIELISFLEYGYTASSGEKADDYGLYLYVYNPSGKDILSDTNKIQFGVKWKKDKKGNFEAVDFKKYSLTVLDINDNNTLIKLKVLNPDSELILKEGSSRRYEISGIEMHEKKYTYEDYKVGYSYTFTGYGKGMSPESLSKSTLQCELGSLLTIKVDAHQVSYLTGDSALGVGYSNQINSVYFSIPSNIEKKYGDLYSIKYEYYHYYTSPMIVTDNLDSYKVLTADRGKIVDDTWKYTLYERDVFQGSVAGYLYSFIYGKKFKDISMGAYHFYDEAIAPSFLTTVFYDSDGWKEGDIIKSADELQIYFRNYNLSYHNGKVFDYSADLFSAEKSKGYHVFERSVNEEFTLQSYADTHHWLVGLFSGIFDMSKYDETVNANYIQKVDSDIWNSNSSKKYLVSEKEIGKLQSFYNNANIKGDNVYLLRYAAANDYYSLDINSEGIGSSEALDGNFLMAQGNVCLNFDFIYFTFGDEENHTVIAAVSNPSDGFFDFVDTRRDGFDWEKILKILLAVILTLLLVWVFVKIVIPALKGVSEDTSTAAKAISKPPNKKRNQKK